MITFEEAKHTLDKYGSLSQLRENGSDEDFQLVHLYMAEQANRLQRRKIGLED